MTYWQGDDSKNNTQHVQIVCKTIIDLKIQNHVLSTKDMSFFILCCKRTLMKFLCYIYTQVFITSCKSMPIAVSVQGARKSQLWCILITDETCVNFRRQTRQSDTSMSKYVLWDISDFCGSKSHQMILVTLSLGGRKSPKRKQNDVFKNSSSIEDVVTYKKVNKKERETNVFEDIHVGFFQMLNSHGKSKQASKTMYISRIYELKFLFIGLKMRKTLVP